MVRVSSSGTYTSTCKSLTAVLLSFLCSVHAALLSPEVDKEVAELHAAMEEGFERIGDLTKQLQVAGAIPSVPTPSAMSPAGQAHVRPSHASSHLDAVKIAAIRKLETDFAAIQQTAFRLGSESQDNTQLSQHPQLHDYIQSLREFRPRVTEMVKDLQRALSNSTGKPIEKPKKQKASKTVHGLAAEDIRARAHTTVAADTRAFKTKAMDIVSTFRERQMQMQDKQRDMQLVMDGPDWPKEDWPLSTTDAKNVGDAEQIIQASLQELTAKTEPIGGLPRIHEAGDDKILEQLVALSEMMSAYCELMDKHVDTVKKHSRSKKKRRRKQKSTPQGEQDTAGGGSLHDRLVNFGGNGNRQNQQPFSWLRSDQPSAQAPHSSFQQQHSSHGGAGSTLGSLSNLAGMSSSLGSLSSLGSFASQAAPNSATASPLDASKFGGFARAASNSAGTGMESWNGGGHFGGGEL